jgi:hypothetical protein
MSDPGIWALLAAQAAREAAAATAAANPFATTAASANQNTSDYLEELAATLASHGSNLAALRREALEQKVSPYLPQSGAVPSQMPGVPPPGVPSMRIGGDPIANTMGNASPFIGQTNLLPDPAWENWGGTTVTTGATITALSGTWSCHHVLNSGTIPSVHGFFGQYCARGLNPLNSAQVALQVEGFAANACDLDVYLYPTAGYSPASAGAQAMPYLVGAVRYSHQDTDYGDATVSISLQILKEAVVAYESPALDPFLLEWGDMPQLLAFTEQTRAEFIGHTYTWRLRIHVVKPATTTTTIILTFGEPQLHFAYSPDPLAYAPILSGWTPTQLMVEADSTSGTLVRSRKARTTYDRYKILVTGATTWGDGAAAADVRLYRSGTKALTIDDGADGAATLKVIGTRLAPPSASQTLVAATALLANAEFVMFTCTGAVTTTAAPTIADGTDGQVLTALNVGTGTWTIKDQGTLASSNLRLTGASVAIAPRNSIKLIYSATVGDWVQVGPLVAVI